MILDSVLRCAAIVLCIDGDAADAAVDCDEMGSYGAAPTFFFHSTSLALNIVLTCCCGGVRVTSRARMLAEGSRAQMLDIKGLRMQEKYEAYIHSLGQ
jgi:hypothetical protein